MLHGTVDRGMDIQELDTETLLGPLNDVERKHAVDRLYVAGDVDLLRHGSRVSIVGSRRVSPEGLARTRSFAKALVERGIVVVSGSWCAAFSATSASRPTRPCRCRPARRHWRPFRASISPDEANAPHPPRG